MTSQLLNQIGLVLGFLGAIILAFSNKVGVVSKGGEIIFEGLDPYDPSKKNKKKVLHSHKRHKILKPIGWLFMALAFLLQLIATINSEP